MNEWKGQRYLNVIFIRGKAENFKKLNKTLYACGNHVYSFCCCCSLHIAVPTPPLPTGKTGEGEHLQKKTCTNHVIWHKSYVFEEVTRDWNPLAQWPNLFQFSVAPLNVHAIWQGEEKNNKLYNYVEKNASILQKTHWIMWKLIIEPFQCTEQQWSE